MQAFLKLLPLILLPVLLPGSANAALRNQLASNGSPYLAMHADDPTAWQQWSRQTVELARKQNKLLFISVGYFSCHWCHVMQKESYRNPAIAAFINKHFIPVKIDRETEPALDAHLIAFIDRTQGYSGWPLNAFLTPEGYPLFATVYQPPKEFLQLMQKLQNLWQDDAQGLSRVAAAEQAGGTGPGKPVAQEALAGTLAQKAETMALQLGAPMTGGFGDASKFPYAPHLQFLLARAQVGKSRQLKEFLQLTLDNMAQYGLRDHLQGGFFRYTVDPGWKTPHFEKMLYDNAQLAQVFLEAATVLGVSSYRDIAIDTLDFMQSEMRDKSGALIASLSAIDDKGVEGGYYLWSRDEIQRLLTTEEWRVYRDYAGMNDPSPLAEGYLPMRVGTIPEIARQYKLAPTNVARLVENSERKLLQHRSKRKLPRDEKLLAGWNGLALSAFSGAASKLARDDYRETAMGIRAYILDELWDGRQLLRASSNGQSMGSASLQDYAAVTRGLLDWAMLTGSKTDYALAGKIVRQAWQRFYTRRGWRLSEPGFIPMESPVDVLPDDHLASPSATIIAVSLELADRLDDAGLRKQAMAALNSGQPILEREPFWYVSHVRAMR